MSLTLLDYGQLKDTETHTTNRLRRLIAMAGLVMFGEATIDWVSKAALEFEKFAWRFLLATQLHVGHSNRRAALTIEKG